MRHISDIIMSEKGRRRIVQALFVTGLAVLLNALYIPLKAVVAQSLLESAWEESQKNGGVTRPWSWADTYPVARLRVPDHGVDHIVLSGDQGNSLAFAPGLHPDSDINKTFGMVVISGHRDTHFNFLQDVSPGEKVVLQGTGGNNIRYQVEEIHIADTRQTELYAPENSQWITLVTCYPFDTVQATPSMRYIVLAKAIDDQESNPIRRVQYR